MTQDPMFLAPVEDDEDEKAETTPAPPYALVEKALIFGENPRGPLTHEAAPGIEVRLVMVTPQLAANYHLLNSKNQRTLGDHVRNTYAADMNDDAWIFLGDPIRFDRNGTLIDGQHRLDAIKKSGKAQLMVVITGLPIDSMKWVDTGRRRTYADTLKMRDIPQHSAVSALIGAMYAWNAGYYGVHNVPRIANGVNAVRPSNAAKDRLYDSLLEKGVDPVRMVQMAQRIKTHVMSGCPTSALGVAATLFSLIDPYQRDEFFARLIDSIEGDERNTRSTYPPNMLRDRMIRSTRKGSPDEELSREEWLHLIVGAWNLWRNGKERETLSRVRKPITPASWNYPDGLAEGAR